MGATTENNKIQDPLGLQTFALSESAYDMVCTLRGAYGRMMYVEMQKTKPDQNQIVEWRFASSSVLEKYHALDWDDFSVVKTFIERCVTEWRDLQVVETPQSIAATYVHHS